MNTLKKDLLTALFMGMILPAFLLNMADLLLNRKDQQAPVSTEPQETIPAPVQLPVILRGTAGTVTEMDMDAYLTGVLLAEMPASFETEALKAQAVAARTYARKAYEIGGKHGDGSVCTKASCCQAYITEETYLLQGGTQEGIDKMKNAVRTTTGMVLTYEEELIEATYFSCSGGSTEDAAAVWGTEFPYLQAVASPGEENASHYTDTLTFTAREFQNALGRILSGSPASWFGVTTYTEGGGVAEMVIGGEIYSGTQLRSLLSLPSTDFTVTAGETITFTTHGYGHRVGMSQYGADAMAVQGCTYEEILAHYYPGTTLTQLV